MIENMLDLLDESYKRNHGALAFSTRYEEKFLASLDVLSARSKMRVHRVRRNRP
jgi:hypothetical protein